MKKLLFILPILIGCSAQVSLLSDDPKPELPCKELSGIYIFHFTEISGGCLPISTSTINTDYVGDKDCEVHKNVVSDNKCHYQVTYKCLPGDGAHADLTGTLNLSTDGNSGTGTLHFIFVDDDAKENICTSDYTIVFER